MRMIAQVFLFGVLILFSSVVHAADLPNSPDEFSFTLNGKSIEPYYLTLKSVGINRDEVLVSLDNLTMILDLAKSYALHGDLEKDGKLYLDVDGARQLVGIVASTNYGRNKVDSFVGLRNSDLKHLRGVCLDRDMSEHAIDLLSHLEMKKVFFRITENAGVGKPRRLPTIPRTVMFLEIIERSSEGIKDFSHMKTFSSLVYLSLHTGGGTRIDLKTIANNKNLTYFDIGGQELDNIGALGQLRQLRHLNLSWCDDLTELSSLRGLTELRYLGIERTGIRDLTPIEGLENLVTINAAMSPVERLPIKCGVALRRLNVLATRLKEEQVAAFRNANPLIRVQHGWTATLRSALEDVDRILVRTGGTCHRDHKGEKTLFEIKNAKVVGDIIGQIVIEPSDRGFHCMCCGEPSFEFYKKGKIATTLGFHHGRSLRWMDGDWPGDGLLSPKSGDFLCELLAKYGVEGPLKDRNEEKRSEKAAEARMAVYRRILSVAVIQRLSEAGSTADAVKAFIVGEEDKGKRAALALRVIGSHSGSWNQRNMLDPIAISVLQNEVSTDLQSGNGTHAESKNMEKIAVTDILNALNANKQDAMVIRGTARWFFGERKHESIPGEKMADLLPLIVEAGMTHPRQVNRRRTMYALEDLKNATATQEIRKVLAGEFKVKSLEPEEEEEPGGMVEFTGRGGDIGEKCSDQALAALILAKIGDTKSLAFIRTLLESENESESKKILKKATTILEATR